MDRAGNFWGRLTTSQLREEGTEKEEEREREREREREERRERSIFACVRRPVSRARIQRAQRAGSTRKEKEKKKKKKKKKKKEEVYQNTHIYLLHCFLQFSFSFFFTSRAKNKQSIVNMRCSCEAHSSADIYVAIITKCESPL
jgi:flagellar biosynthesis GTPase FlhF